MSSIVNHFSVDDLSPEERADYEAFARDYEARIWEAWTLAHDAGHYEDEAPVDDFPDWAPEPEDAAWWRAECEWLESQRRHIGPRSMAEHEARLADARRRLGMISQELAEHIAYGRGE